MNFQYSLPRTIDAIDALKSQAMRSLFFDHVPKCGGLALRQYLQEIYGTQSVTPEGGFVTYRQAIEAYSSFGAIALHVWHEPREAFVADRHHVTVLRNPLSRVLSHIEFSGHDIQILGHGFIQKGRTLGVEELIFSDDDDVLAFTSNLMTKHFSQILWDGRTRMTDEQRLDYAKRALEMYDLVGIQEELDDCAAALACQIGAPAVERLAIVNATSVPKTGLSSKAAKRLEAINAMDIELWVHAKKLFHAQRRRAMVSAANTIPSSAKAEKKSQAQEAETTNRRASSPAHTRFGTQEIEIVSVTAFGGLSFSPTVLCGDALLLQLSIHSHIKEDDVTIGVSISDAQGKRVFGTNTRLLGYRLRFDPGCSYWIEYKIPNQLGLGMYSTNVAAHRGASHLIAAYDIWENAAAFQVVGNIGLHFEGSVKLHPTVDIAVVDGPAPAFGWISTDKHEFQRMGMVNPMIEKLAYQISVNDAPDRISVSEAFLLPLVLRNLGENNIPGIGMRAVYVSYHWRTDSGAIILEEGERTPFPQILEANASCLVHAKVIAPSAPGNYFLDLCLVQDGVKWFDDENAILRVPMNVSVTREHAM